MRNKSVHLRMNEVKVIGSSEGTGTRIIVNREAWLQAAVEEMRPIFRGHGYEVPDLQVSVGWPSRGGLANAKRTIGQCWYGETTKDNKPQLFISPVLDEVTAPQGVLATLVHEVVHVVAGPDAKHGPAFVKVMKKVGLVDKPTATSAGPDLIVRLEQMSKELGVFPHSKIVPNPNLKKQTNRQLKCNCSACGYIARTVKQWLDIYGPPICPCNKQPMQGPETGGEEGE